MSVLQNFYKETIAIKLLTGNINMYVSANPTPTEGILVINPGHATQREIVRYSGIGSDGSGSYVTLTERGVGGTTEQTHEVSEPVRMNITAEHWAEIVAAANGGIPATYLDLDPTLAADSDVKVPSQKAIKEYVDTEKMDLTTDQEIATGVKTFVESPIVPTPTTDFQAATKKYIDEVAVAGSPNAGDTTKGIVQIATQEEVDAGTDLGSTGAKLVVSPSMISSAGNVEPGTEDTLLYLNPSAYKQQSENTKTNVLNNSDIYSITFNATGRIMYVAGLYYIEQYALAIPYLMASADLVGSYYPSELTSSMYNMFISKDGTKMYHMDSADSLVYEYTLATTGDITSAVFVDSYDYSAESGIFYGIALSEDGTKFYGISSVGVMYQYTLSIAWDITSATYDSVAVTLTSLGVGSTCSIISFSQDGAKMYAGNTSNDIYELDLATDWDISTMTYSNRSVLCSGESQLQAIHVPNDGSFLFFGGSAENDVFGWYMQTPYEVDSAVSTNISNSATNVYDVQITDDGLRYYYLQQSNNTVYGYDLTVAFDVTSKTNEKTFALTTQLSSPSNFFITYDGARLYAMGDATNTMYCYDLGTAWDVSTAVLDSGNNYPYDSINAEAIGGMWLTPDGTKLIMGARESDRIYMMDLSTPWDLTTRTNTTDISINSITSTINSIRMAADGKILIVGSNSISYFFLLDTAYDISSYVNLGSLTTTGSVSLALSNDLKYGYAAIPASNFVGLYQADFVTTKMKTVGGMPSAYAIGSGTAGTHYPSFHANEVNYDIDGITPLVTVTAKTMEIKAAGMYKISYSTQTNDSEQDNSVNLVSKLLINGLVASTSNLSISVASLNPDAYEVGSSIVKTLAAGETVGIKVENGSGLCTSQLSVIRIA